MKKKYPKSFVDLLNSVEAKRPSIVIQHILKHGYITSQELKDTYGYNHPPRAVRDVREHGIPLITYRIEGTDGKSIAAYRFGNPNDVSSNVTKSAGRTVLSKALKQALIEKYGSKCFWAYPEDYGHIAGKQQRIVSIVFTGNEIEDYNRDFCTLRGVSEKTYYYWLRRLRVATADALGPQFIEVKLDEKAVQPGILSIRYMEAELTITRDTTSEVLQLALAVLKRL